MNIFGKTSDGRAGVLDPESAEQPSESREAALLKAKADYEKATEHLTALEDALEQDRRDLTAPEYGQRCDDISWLSQRVEDLRLMLVAAQSAFDEFNSQNYNRQLLIEKRQEMEYIKTEIAKCSAEFQAIKRLEEELPLRKMRAAGGHVGLLQRFAQLEMDVQRLEKQNANS
jgi:hypothetical protein